jgi:hypothetical protein
MYIFFNLSNSSTQEKFDSLCHFYCGGIVGDIKIFPFLKLKEIDFTEFFFCVLLILL